MATFGVSMKHVEERKELERRRGARLLAAGQPQAEVARQVGVSRQTVMCSERLRQQGGLEVLRRADHLGRPERLSESQREELVRLLKAGSHQRLVARRGQGGPCAAGEAASAGSTASDVASSHGLSCQLGRLPRSSRPRRPETAPVCVARQYWCESPPRSPPPDPPGLAMRGLCAPAYRPGRPGSDNLKPRLRRRACQINCVRRAGNAFSTG